MTKKTLLTILLFVLVLLVIVFFIYLRIEGFNTTTTLPNTNPQFICPPQQTTLESVISKIANYQIDVEPTGDGATYFLKYYGINSNDTSSNTNTPAGILAVDTNNNLVVQILNDVQQGLSNRWNLNKLNNDDNTLVISIQKCSTNDCSGVLALTYTSLYMENTILSYLPFSSSNENQLWKPASKIVRQGLPVNKGVSIASKLNKTIGTPVNLSELNLNDINEQKVSDVLNLISQNLQSYKQMTSSDSGASLGISGGAPIKVNLSLSGALDALSGLGRTTEDFEDANNVRKLLDNYENKDTENKETVYTLDTALGSVVSCPSIDAADYTISRVGECNCNLSQLNQ
jgi:hypothetical protein